MKKVTLIKNAPIGGVMHEKGQVVEVNCEAYKELLADKAIKPEKKKSE